MTQISISTQPFKQHRDFLQVQSCGFHTHLPFLPVTLFGDSPRSLQNHPMALWNPRHTCFRSSYWCFLLHLPLKWPQGGPPDTHSKHHFQEGFVWLWQGLHQRKPKAKRGALEIFLHVWLPFCNSGWNIKLPRLTVPSTYMSLKHFPQMLLCIALVIALSYKWELISPFHDEETEAQRKRLFATVTQPEPCISLCYSTSNTIIADIYGEPSIYQTPWMLSC